MAHGVHLNEAELKLFAQRGAAIACCPLSNVYFAGADLPLVKVQAQIAFLFGGRGEGFEQESFGQNWGKVPAT
eukprot:5628190-Pleurochrysis_carterae.AAC.2